MSEPHPDHVAPPVDVDPKLEALRTRLRSVFWEEDVVVTHPSFFSLEQIADWSKPFDLPFPEVKAQRGGDGAVHRTECTMQFSQEESNALFLRYAFSKFRLRQAWSRLSGGGRPNNRQEADVEIWFDMTFQIQTHLLNMYAGLLKCS